MPEPKGNVKELLDHWKVAKANKENHSTMFDNISAVLSPNSLGYRYKTAIGERKTDRLFDSTGVVASNLLAASLHAALTNPAVVWFLMRFTDDELQNQKDLKDALQDRTDVIFAGLANSNFNTQINELYLDLIRLGTGVIFVELREVNGERVLNFRSVHLSNIWLGQSFTGEVDIIYERITMTARAALKEYEEHKERMPKVVQAAEEKPESEVEFLKITRPNPESKKGEIASDQKRPYLCHHISLKDEEIVMERGYYEMPYMAPRWSKNTEDVWGFGLGHMAYPDIMSLNEMKRMGLSGMGKDLDPPVKYRAGSVLGNLDLRSGGKTAMTNINDAQPWQSGSNWPAYQAEKGDLRESIREVFFWSQLQLPDRATDTATEARIRYELMQRLLGPTFGRLNSELLNPLIKRVYSMMLRAGLFGEAPDGLDQEEDIEIEYTGPLARAQKMGDVEAIERFVGYLAGIRDATGDPKAMISFDPAGAADVVADRLGVPADALRGEEDQEAESKRIDQSIEQQRTMANAQQSAELANANLDIAEKRAA